MKRRKICVFFIVFSLISLFIFAKYISDRIESLREKNVYERINEVMGIILLIIAWIILVLALTIFISLFLYLT